MRHAFIVGCPRSGTTWTALLLAQHAEVRLCQQVGVMVAAETYWRWWRQGERRDDQRYINCHVRFDRDADAPRFEPLMTRTDALRICRSMADQTYAHAAATEGGAPCTVVVDKTPENGRHAEFLAELMPDAYFLHVIRDPRATFASHRHGAKQMKASFPTDPRGGATYWENDVRRCRKLGDLASHYREVRYESLTSDGPAELTGILEWLGLTAEPEAVERAFERTRMEMLRDTPGAPKGFFRRGHAGGWRDELGGADLQTLEYFARDLMVELGYEPVHPESDHAPRRVAVRDALRRLAKRARAVAG